MATTARGYTYPASSDHVRMWEHIETLAEDVDDDVGTLVAPAVTTTTATLGTVATGFTVVDVRGATLLGGKLIHVDLYITRSGASITATTGNIPDTTMFTLNSAYIPTHEVSCVWSNGTQSGEAVINTSGQVNLRTASATVTSGDNIRLTAVYIKS